MPSDWAARREEMYHTAVELQYGTLPPEQEFLEVEALCHGKSHSSYKIHTGTHENPITLVIKVILPNGLNRPIIVDGDLCTGHWIKDGFIDAAIKKDIGWILFDRAELAHDIRGEGRRKGALYNIYPNYTFRALGAWAWGYSRCVDALEKLAMPQIDLSCIVFSGHSRGGKAALLAGAIDTRAAVVNPNEACLGACGCYRVHMSGDYLDLPNWRSETLLDLWNENDFWLGPEMGLYADREAELPLDAHFLKSMVAPRVLFVSEAAGDIWANPVGSWQTTMAAGEVFIFLQAKDNLFWYFRPGIHLHSVCDVEMLVNIIRHKHDSEPLNDYFYHLPFGPIDRIYKWRAPSSHQIT